LFLQLGVENSDRIEYDKEIRETGEITKREQNRGISLDIGHNAG
jgi:hypothetical protein